MSKNQDIAQRRRQRKQLRRAARRRNRTIPDSWTPPAVPMRYPTGEALRHVQQSLMPSTEEVTARVRQMQETLIKRRLENIPAAYSEDGEPLTRDQGTALTLVGQKVNWTSPAIPTPLKDMASIPLLQRGHSVPFGERPMIVREQWMADYMLVRYGWPCKVEGCDGWRNPTSETDIPRIYKCDTCGFEETIGG